MAGNWQTFKAFSTLSFHNTFAYRGQMLVWLLARLLGFIGIIFVWNSALEGKTVSGYSFSDLVTYYFIGDVVIAIIGMYPFDFVSELIKDGTVAAHILKPVNMYWRFLGEEVGWHVNNTILFILIYAVVYNFISHFFNINLNLIQLLLFVGSLIIGIFVNYGLSLALATAAFWLTHVEALGSFFWMFLVLLGGQIVPLEFFPAGWQNLVRLLPFRFMYSFPLEVYMGKYTNQSLVFSFAIGIAWAITFYFVFNFFWKKGLKIYTSFGY